MNAAPAPSQPVNPPRIGLSVRIMYPDPRRSALPTKTLHYAEDGMVRWLRSGGALVLPVPAPPEGAEGELAGYAEALDGLVLQGGSDIAPQAYGETPLREEWAGDPRRDAYELALFRAFASRGRPILGICRGCQLINVALGGSLYQDIAAQAPGARAHRGEPFDQHFHELRIEPDSGLARLYPGVERTWVNSIHHQGLKALGRNLIVEARSEPDGMIEAVRQAGAGYVVGLQWHPEFIAPGDRRHLPGGPVLAEFLTACRAPGRP